LLEQDTRVSSARVVLPNGDGRWQPGLFVNASVAVDDVRVAVAVPEEAIVRTAEGPAVFHARGGSFVLEHVSLGRSDGRMTEVTAGVAAGDTVVVAQTFILKSELGKGEVAHEH
jgi:cobalt-zinc-cadmium efflux system membrane fusion protein